MQLRRLRSIAETQIRLAGPRFLPGTDPNAPNLQIQSLAETFDAIGFSPDFRRRMGSMRKSLEDAIAKNGGANLNSVFHGRHATPSALGKLIEQLEAAAPGEAEPMVDELRLQYPRVQRRLGSVIASLARRASAAPEGGDLKSRLNYRSYALGQVRDAIQEIGSFLDSPASSVLVTNALLLRGQWGTGKTHALCDLSRARLRQKLPTVLFLAQGLPSGDPLEGLCRITGLAHNPDELLDRLNAMGRERGGRTLLVIDAINEGDREGWRRALPKLCRALVAYPHVGLVLSCRSPFEKLVLRPRPKTRIQVMNHEGFTDIEFDAQVAFFSHYGIPTPQYPLLTPEFSRPLFLRVFCEAERKLSQNQRHRHLREIASGQKGMTYFLEHFVRQIGRQVEDDHDLERGFCWKLLKGHSVSPGGEPVGIAPVMADQQREHLTRTECLRMIDALSGGATPHRRDAILRRLVTDGLLIELLEWNENEPRIAPPFQRFSDHLVARHLLNRHLDPSSPKGIRKSFQVGQPLGELFKRQDNRRTYEDPGLASAIILEFPERVKKSVSPDRRELFHYLPSRKGQIDWGPFIDPFLEGLPWRHRDTFSRQTDWLVGQLLSGAHERVRDDTYEILIGLACRVGHPYANGRLWRFLSKLPMSDRDLTWTEFVRRSYSTMTLFRILAWVESDASKRMNELAARTLASLLPMFLSSTRRQLRDRVTRALFLVGLRYPQVLFDATLKSLAFNDPYVPERLMAASYGVAMCRWASPGGLGTRRALPGFAQSLISKMFLPRSPHKMRHSLTKDAALGIIELAGRVDPAATNRGRRYLRRPFPALGTQFRHPDDIGDAEVEAVKGALHMDFDNYTLGRLVHTRQNYQSSQPEYVRVRRQIMGRMFDLGYTQERFGEIDKEIGRDNWNAREPVKTDRYGKKYSWIAYFEMFGLRQDRGQLGEGRRKERSSDCDLDPSFPEPARVWTPRLGNPFATPNDIVWFGEGPCPVYRSLWHRTEVDGTTGPWVLLDSFIGREVPGEGKQNRRIISFIQAVLIRRGTIARLRRSFNGVRYVGNEMPRTPGDHLTFAGEIPWSHHFGIDLRRGDGTPRSNYETLFHRHHDQRLASGVRAELIVHDYSWESYHSALNEAAPLQFPSPSICETLGLRRHGQDPDMFDSDGRMATLYRMWPKDARGFASHLFYLREDLLQTYLTKTNQQLVWLIWGERQLLERDSLGGAARGPQMEAIWDRDGNKYRGMFAGPAGERHLPASG